MKLPTLSSPLKLFSPAPAGPALGMAGATGSHMMFASSGGGRGGDYDQDDYGMDDDFGDEPMGEPEGDEPPRPRSTRTVRARNAGVTDGQPRTAQNQPDERYWTDYLRIALPVIGLLLMIGLLWFWATQLIGDSPETTDPATEEVGLVNQSTPAPTNEPVQAQTTQPGSNNTISIGDPQSTPEGPAANTNPPANQPAAGDNTQAEDQTEPEKPAADGAFASNDPVVVTEDGVNVRPAASLAGDPITMLNSGDELTIASGPVEAEGYVWWEVILPGGGVGWVVEDFIEPAG